MKKQDKKRLNRDTDLKRYNERLQKTMWLRGQAEQAEKDPHADEPTKRDFT